jgi:hypothetical protein
MAAKLLAICVVLAGVSPAVASKSNSGSCGAPDDLSEDECEAAGVHLLQAKQGTLPPVSLALKQKQHGLWEKLASVKGSQGKITVAIKDVRDVVLELGAAMMNATAADVEGLLKIIDKNADGNLDENELRHINTPVIDRTETTAPQNGTVSRPSPMQNRTSASLTQQSTGTARGSWTMYDSTLSLGLSMYVYSDPNFPLHSVILEEVPWPAYCMLQALTIASFCGASDGYTYIASQSPDYVWPDGQVTFPCRCIPNYFSETWVIDYGYYMPSRLFAVATL